MPIVSWLSSLPSWLAFCVILIAYETFAVVISVGARALYARLGFPFNAVFTASWIQVVGGLNAVLFAFVIVTLWSSLHVAAANVDTEALTIRMLWRDAAPANRPEIVAYAKAVVDSWRSLCTSQPSRDPDTILRSMERNMKPSTPALAGAVDRDVATLADLHDMRARALHSGVPGELWIALIGLSAMIIAMASLVHPERRDVHLILAVCTALAMSLFLWVALMLDFPYCGGTTVSPQPMEQTLTSIVS